MRLFDENPDAAPGFQNTLVHQRMNGTYHGHTAGVECVAQLGLDLQTVIDGKMMFPYVRICCFTASVRLPSFFPIEILALEQVIYVANLGDIVCYL